MTHNVTHRSGTSKPKQQVGVPPYPAMLPFSLTTEIKNLLCYVIKHYGTEGISAIIQRHPKDGDVNINVVFGDWNGSPIDIADGSNNAKACLHFMTNHCKAFVETMRLIRLPIAQFYLVVGKNSLILTDIRKNTTQLSGPGMVRDLFGKSIETQEVIKIEPILDKTIDAIDKRFGSYAGDLILKPSRFRTVERAGVGACPLYVEIRR